MDRAYICWMLNLLVHHVTSRLWKVKLACPHCTVKYKQMFQTVSTTLRIRLLNENCTLLGYYTASSGDFLPTFWDNLSVPSSGFKNQKIPFVPLWNSWTPRMGPIGCPETTVRNYHHLPRNNREECSSQLLCSGSLKSRKACVFLRLSPMLANHFEPKLVALFLM